MYIYIYRTTKTKTTKISLILKKKPMWEKRDDTNVTPYTRTCVERGFISKNIKGLDVDRVREVHIE